MNTKSYIKPIVKMILLGIYFVFILEVCARIDDLIKWNAPIFENYSRENLTLVDSYGLRNRPNSQYQKWKINEHGFRGDSISKDKPAGKVRIMVLGASETFGLYESEDKEYPKQLQNILDLRAPGKYQVINAAVPGLSPPRIQHLYEKWLKTFSPDIAIYYPSPSVYLMRNPPAPVFSEKVQNSKKLRLECRIVAKASIVLKRFLPVKLQAMMKEILIKRAIAGRSEEWIFHNPPPERLALFESQLQELVQGIQKNGTKILLATHATVFSKPISDEEKQMLIGWRKLYPYVAENAFLEMERIGNIIIKKVADHTTSEVVDIDASLPKTTENFADHVHFTTAGAGAVAEMMAEAVLMFFPPKVEAID